LNVATAMHCRAAMPCDPPFDIQTGLLLLWSDQ